ncbi:MAG: HAD-IC family P-type ATPase, partial [Coprobacillus cateniformis]
MSFKVLHRGYQHIRLSSSFSLTLDIQDYLRSWLKMKRDRLIQFIWIMTFTLRMKEGFSVLENAEAFLKKIDKGKVSDLMTLPIRREESAYSIVSGATIKRLLFRSFVPYPIRYIWTCYQALGYVKEAYQTLARKELTMEVLDCSAILLSLFMNQSKTASNIMFMLDLGNHLDQWSLKTATDLEQSLLAKESDVFLVRGDMVISIKSSDVQVGDVLVVSQGNEILFDGQVVSGLGMVNESSLTGESFPVEKKEGDSVCANTVLETGELRIRVTDNQINSRILQLINLMKKSEESKKTKQRHFIRMADKVVKFNFLGAGLTYLLTGSFSKAISFLLVDFSCALKISTPVAYLTAIKEGLNREMVIKDGDVLEKYLEVDTFLFDKTGTITTSYPLVEKVLPFG